MNRIITITINSAIDNEIEVENFELGKNIRVLRETYFPAGKGINVARTISLLQQEVTSIAFTGRPSKELFDSINSPFLKTINILTEKPTRCNISITDRHKGLVTFVHKDGLELSKKEILALEKTVEDIVGNEDIVVISGSLPKNSDLKTYYKLIGQCNRKGAKVIFDSCGEWFKYGIRANPFLIKPNIEEFELYAGINFNEDDHAIVKFALNEFKPYDISIIIISLEARGVLVIDNRTRRALKAWIKNKITLKTTVGSGDAFVGGFAVSLRNKENVQDAVRLAVACGAANQSTQGPGVIDLDNVKQLMKEVEIKSIDSDGS